MTIKMEADFSGWATVFDIECTDGRTIKPEAFKHMDGKKVPLVWAHQHNDPENILGHALLEYRPTGVYAYGYFNESTKGLAGKEMVEHKDIESLSIFANQLKQAGKDVKHGNIKEVSLVIAGANRGALIDNVYIRHSEDDEPYVVLDEATIYNEKPLEHEDKAPDKAPDADAEGEGPTAQDVFNTLSEEQKNVVFYMIEEALDKTPPTKQDDAGDAAAHSEGDDDSDDEDPNIQHQEGTEDMGRNVFEQNKGTTTEGDVKTTLSHDDMKSITEDAQRPGNTLKGAIESYGLAHGITNLEVLFPDAKSITDRPEFISRRVEWVSGVLAATRHTPFSRIKSLWADITADEARAKGYIKGNFKKEEFFSVAKRVTTPTTIYKKQKLDRDDIIDITDFDVVAWMKWEMRLMLDEEIARAILIGDGREVDDEDKIKDPIGSTEGAGIRSILNDHELYVTTVNVNIDDANSSQIELADGIIDGMQYYKGSGSPVFYTTLPQLTKMLLTRDTQQRRLWPSAAALADELMVSKIVTVEVMETVPDLVGIIVNLTDYNVGADRGGEVNLFDDFDIDYNQQKYLIETRISGALIKLKSAVVVKRTAAANVLVTPTVPGFVDETGIVTIPTKTGVVYKNEAGTTLTAGAQTALAAGASLKVHATPASGYYFKDNANDDWTFTRPSA